VDFVVRVLEGGQVVSHQIDALDLAEAQKHVSVRFVHALSVTPKRGKNHFGINRGGQLASRFALLEFSDELLVLLEAGLTVVEACEAIAEKATDSIPGQVIRRLLKGMQAGLGFSGALTAMPEHFPTLFVNIVRSGERSSNLVEVLHRYVAHEQRLREMKSKMMRAAIYPVVLSVVGLLVTLFLLGYVVPKFASVYLETGRPLPLATQVLLNWGQLVGTHPWLLGLGAMAALSGGTVWFWQARRSGTLARGIASLPLIARHVRAFERARLYLTLGMLLEGGIPVMQGLDLAAATLGARLRPALMDAREMLRQGKSISQAFDAQSLTTPVALRMLKVGERSGRMGEMMSRIALTYDRDVAKAIDLFSRVFEPVLMVGIGLLIGTVVVLLYMPIFDLAGSMR